MNQPPLPPSGGPPTGPSGQGDPLSHVSPGGYLPHHTGGDVPPATSTRSRAWIIGLSLVGAVLLLCCGCCGIFGFVGYRLVDNGRRDVRESAEQYFHQLKEQDYSRAYRMLCDRAQDSETSAEFGARMRSGPRLVDYDIDQVTIGDDGLNRFEITVDEDYVSGSGRREHVDVTSDGGDYRVCP